MLFCASKRVFGIVILIFFAASSIFSPASAALGKLSPRDFSQMYHLAAKGDVVSLKAAIHRGLNINSINQNGDTALCVAVQNRNAKAYNTLMAAGANPRPACSWKISYWHNFTQSPAVKSGALWQNNGYTHPVYGVTANNSNTWTWVGGGLLLAGGAALAFGGGGGGGGSGDAGTSGGLTCEFGCKTYDNEGKCIECKDNTGGGCNENPCGEGCFTDLTCAAGSVCTETNTCGGCEKCEEVITSEANFIINSTSSVTNEKNLFQSGKNRVGTWGGIYAVNQSVDNSGNISMSEGQKGVGILSCLYEDLDRCLNEITEVKSGSITNSGTISVASDKSFGILATNLYGSSGNNSLNSLGSIVVTGADSTGIALIGGGDLHVLNTIVMNGNMTVEENLPSSELEKLQLHPENSAVYVNIKKNGAAPGVTNLLTNASKIIIAPSSSSAANGKVKIATGMAVALNDATHTQQIDITNSGDFELDSSNASTDSQLIGLAAVDYNPGDDKKISILNTGTINIKDQGLAMFIDGAQLDNKGTILANNGGDGITAYNSIINQYGKISTDYYITNSSSKAFNLHNSTLNIINGAVVDGDISAISSGTKSYVKNDGILNSLYIELGSGEFSNLMNGQASISGLEAEKIINNGQIKGNAKVLYANEIYISSLNSATSSFQNGRDGAIQSAKLAIGMKLPNMGNDLYRKYFNLFQNEGNITTDHLTINTNLFTNTGNITTGTLKYVGHGANGNNVDLTGINFLPQDKLLFSLVSLASVDSDNFKLGDINLTNTNAEISTTDLLGNDHTVSGILVENISANNGEPTSEVGRSTLDVNSLALAFNQDAILQENVPDTINGINIERSKFDTTLQKSLNLTFSQNVRGINMMGTDSSFTNLGEMNVKGKSNVTGVLATGNGSSVVNKGKIIVKNLSPDQTDPVKTYAAYGIYGNNATVETFAGSIIDVQSSLSGENTYGIFLTGEASGKNEGSIITQSQEGASGVKATQTTSAGFENIGKIEVNSLGGIGMFADGYVDGTTANNRYAAFLNSGDILMYAQGSSGMTAHGYKSYVRNIGSIGLLNSQSVGMYAVNGGLASNRGTIDLGTNIANNIGMYGTDGTIYNEGAQANIQGSAEGGSLIGIYLSGNSSGENSGLINLNANDSIGIHAVQTKGTFTNSGTITLTGNNNIGMWADGFVNDGSNGANDREVRLVNTGRINITGANAIGMMASGSKSIITNNGTITLSSGQQMVVENGGTIAPSENARSFVLSHGAMLVNKGQISTVGKMDLDAWRDSSSKIVASKNSRFSAQSLKGTLTAGADITTGSNRDHYVSEGVLQGDQIDVTLNSNSAMFKAGLRNNNQDIVMSRQSFESIIADSALATFLENNYQQNRRVDFFDTLKAASSTPQLNAMARQQLGGELLPTIDYQNIQRARYINRSVEELIIDDRNPKDERISVISNNFYEERKSHHGLSGYEDHLYGVSGLFDKALSPELRYGIGFGLYRSYAEFDGGDTRRDVIFQLYNPYHFENSLWGAVVMPYVGYSHGAYKRLTQGKKYNPNVDVWYYGLSNRAYLKTSAGGFELEPTSELNINGAYQDTISERDGIKVNSHNAFSVEAGLGAYASKQINWEEYGRFKIRAGAMYYYELNPEAYDTITAKMFGMDGSYSLSGYDNNRSRGSLSLRGDYALKNWNIYAEMVRLLEHDQNMVYNVGVKLSF